MTELQREAMEAARHELATIDGLYASDSEQLAEPWRLDTKATIAKLDAALSEPA